MRSANMRTKVSKIEWAALSALAFAFVYPSAGARIGCSVLALLVFVVGDAANKFVGRFLVQAFRLPFWLVVVLTCLETTRQLCPYFSGFEIAFIALPVLLISVSSPKFTARLETGFLFVIFVLLLVVVQNTGFQVVDGFTPLAFLVVAAGVPCLTYFLRVGKGRSR